MPHAVDETDVQQDQDDEIISRLLNNESSGQNNELDFMSRELETGEKADDAQDFEDISDDDLASDNDEDTGHASRPLDDTTILENGHDDQNQPEAESEDDLFGEEDNAFIFGDDPPAASLTDDKVPIARNEKPTKPRIALPGTIPALSSSHDGGALFQSPTSLGPSPSDQVAPELVRSSASPEAAQKSHEPEEEDEELDDALALQRALFARAGRRSSQELPDAPETDLELFFSIWPSYDPTRTARFTELFPPPPAPFNWKAPLKAPKTLNITKLSLDIAPDTERSFRLTTTAQNAKAPQKPDFEDHSIVRATRPSTDDQSSGDEIDLIDEQNDKDQIGGATWKDIELACCDWDSISMDSSVSPKRRFSPHADSGIFMQSQDETQDDRPHKRAKLSASELVESATIHPIFPSSLDDPEHATEKLAKRVALDIYDADLLIDETVQRTSLKRRALAAGDTKEGAKDLTRRYNISNDDAYDLLKENHQHKVRSTLGNVAIDHSMPAVKLQYPFYRVKLEPRQSRSFHRPQLSGIRVGKEIRFSKPKTVKKKHLRGRETRDIFSKSEDLSMGDNSSGMLLEYAEEMPMMLSNFGMGNRVVNYYRRKDDQDSSRPKEEIGETHVLLPQDRSPFATFGYVDPGELVPAIQNGLYRAPIFKHDGRPTDFLVACSTTSEHGNRFFLRNMENMHVVGQQFPSTEIPGEHSRKVTDAAKRRLKAISYRIWRKWSFRRGDPLTNQVVQAHLPGSDIAQNRGKMREFMKYDKINSIWIPKDGETPPDSDELRNLIKPEDICLLDSMQVGVQHLNDLGLRRDEEANEDDDEKEGTNIELLLAPWSTTKNFINACQGKAMLQLHGEGDPTGRGEGFSFIKTSMKGGFRALGESIEERLDAKRLKENHGHSYNVAKQQKAYEESIRRIWRAQNESLSSKAEHSDTEVDIDDEPEDFINRATTPRASFGGNNPLSRREDESVSQFSRNSLNRKNQTMIITRTQHDKFGNIEEVPVTITNPRVISAYKKAKFKDQAARIDVTKIQKTGDAEFDAMQIKAAEEELERLYRNVDRRNARERAKGIVSSPGGINSPMGDDDEVGPGTPHNAGPGTGKRGGRKKVNPEGTGRRCANCGQIGHIKTNKKLCPMLNGTMKPEDIHTGFGGASDPNAGDGGGGAAGGTGDGMNDGGASAAQTPGGFGGMNLPTMEI